MTKHELVHMLRDVPDGASVLLGRNPVHVVIESEAKDFVILDDSVAAFLTKGLGVDGIGNPRVLFNDIGKTPPAKAADPPLVAVAVAENPAPPVEAAKRRGRPPKAVVAPA
jgi:hypothetical protein